LWKVNQTPTSQLVERLQVMQILSKETTSSRTMKNKKKRGSLNWIIPILKQGSNMSLNIIKLANKYRFPQLIFWSKASKFLLWILFSCGNFGHKVVSCILFRYNRNVRTILNKYQKAMVQNSLSFTKWHWVPHMQ
jgi:hypothetical protein